MTVTRLEELSSKRVRVFTNEDISFVLYKSELSAFGIETGQEISDKAFTEITERLLPKRAKLRALNLLKARPYTVRGLTDKLKEGYYPEYIVDEAIEYVSSYGYLDDEQYALDYINTYKDRKNRTKLKQELFSKGVSAELIDKALDEELGSDISYEKEQIEKFLRKKHFNREETSRGEKEKLLAALYRKGYSADMCIRAMDEYND